MAEKQVIDEDQLQEMLASPSQRRQAFSVLVDRYSKQIYWQLRRMVYTHEDADDLLQNTFIKAWQAIEGFRGEARVSTWLYRIAHYEALNHLKRKGREDERYIRPNDDADASRLLDRLQADEYFDGDQYELAFQKALLSLPEKQQQVFRLRYYDEMSYEQISALTGTSVGALKASYYHASRKIADKLKAEDI